MKLIWALIVIAWVNNSLAQAPFVQKKIAQARYNFTNNNWVGLDSNIYNYNNSGNEVINTSLNTLTGIWDWNLKSINTYDANEKLIQTIRQRYQNNTWVNQRKFDYILNSVDSLLFSTDSNWNSTLNQWIYNGRITNQYNTDNQLTETLLQSKDINGNPINALKTTYIYDVLKKYLNETTTYSWDIANQMWLNENKNIYYYNFNDSLSQDNYYELKSAGTTLDTISMANYYYDITNKLDLKITSLYHPDSHFYFLYLKEDYAINTNNQLTQKVFAIYDTMNMWWVYYQTDNLNYTSGNLLEEYISTSTNTSVTSNYTYKLIYNADNNIIDSSYSTGTLGNWVEKYKTTYNYDIYKNRTYKLIAENLGGGNYGNIRQEFYYYNQQPLALQTALRTNGIKCFPNPAVNEIHIMLDNIPIHTPVDIIVYDINGKKRVETSEIKRSEPFSLPVSYLPSGTYIIQCKAGAKLYTTKFVK